MGIWGKIMGGVTGLAIGGPIGLLLGALGGHWLLDRQSKGSKPPYADHQTSFNTDAESMRFTIAVVALSAKLAKADGLVTRDEIQRFQQLFTVEESELPSVRKFYNLAKQDTHGYQSYAEDIAALFAHNPIMREQILLCLAHIAFADGRLHPQELAMLTDIARIFSLSHQDLDRILALAKDYTDGETGDDTHRQSNHQSHSFQQAEAANHDYAILGITAESSWEEIQSSHRKLVRLYHPDQLVAKSLPPDLVQHANDKLARINAAFDRIKKQNGK